MSVPVIPFEAGETRLDWLALCDAFEAGHRLPRAEIADSFLYRGADTLLSRAAWIDGLGLAGESAAIFPGNGGTGPPTGNGGGGRYPGDGVAPETERPAEVRETLTPPLVAEITTRTAEVKGSLLEEVAAELDVETTVEAPTFVG